MVVTFRYRMENADGIVLEDNFSGVPTRYLHGSGEIFGPLQQQMEGMAVGDRRRLVLSRRQDGSEQNYFFEVRVEHLRPADSNEVMLGYPIRVDGDECPENCECHDQ